MGSNKTKKKKQSLASSSSTTTTSTTTEEAMDEETLKQIEANKDLKQRLEGNFASTKTS